MDPQIIHLMFDIFPVLLDFLPQIFISQGSLLCCLSNQVLGQIGQINYCIRKIGKKAKNRNNLGPFLSWAVDNTPLGPDFLDVEHVQAYDIAPPTDSVKASLNNVDTIDCMCTFYGWFNFDLIMGTLVSLQFTHKSFAFY